MAVLIRPAGQELADSGTAAVWRGRRDRPTRVPSGAAPAVAPIAAAIALVCLAAPAAPARAQGIPPAGEAVTDAFRPPQLSNPPAELPVEPTPFAPTPTESVVMNLIRLLVEQGTISRDVADALIAQARAEAEAAKPVGALLSEPGRVSVPYIPAPVRQQIAEDVKQDVLIQARAGNWAPPNALPEWVSRIRVFGDIRSRFEYVGFGGDNLDPPDGFVDFNEINTGSPIVLPADDASIGLGDPAPLLNTTEERNRFRLRGRLGVEAQIADEVSAVIRVATGSDNGPVSTNQTLGGASESGQGTNFSKYQIWLDQAYIRIRPIEELTIDIGRAPNPFFRTDLLWDDDVQFDGASIRGEFPINDQISPFFTFGAFPIYNSAFNFVSDQFVGAQESRNRYLIGSQVGAKYKPDPQVELKFSVANYYFNNIQGETGDCLIVETDDPCPTDDTRQQFSQKGNTLIPLRNIELFPAPLPGAPSVDPQYYGLASDFNVLALNFRVDYSGFDPIHIIFDAEYANNLAFDKGNLASQVVAFNAAAPAQSGRIILPVDSGSADLGSQGFYVNLTVGHPEIDERWDWKVGLGYKYLETDAAVDSFVDSDFHLGGTNAKGFILQGQLGVAKNTWVSARWLTSQEIAGPPLDIDVIQVDLNARF